MRVCVVLLALLWAADGGGEVRADPADDDFAVAQAHYAQQRWKLAAEGFEEFLRKYPNDSRKNQSLFLWAESLVQLGRLDRAGPIFEEYLKAAPNDPFVPVAIFRSGEIALLGGDMPRAVRYLEEFRKLYPDHRYQAYALPYLGEALLARPDAAAAVAVFEEALRRFPDGPMQDDCRLGLGRALASLGRIDEAQRYFEALAGKPNSRCADDAQFQLGALYYSIGRFREAADALGAFESRWLDSPMRSQALLGRGWALYKLQRWAEARKVFQSLGEDPTVGLEAHYWTGVTYREEGDLSRANEVLSAVVAAAESRKHPLEDEARVQSADVLLRCGRYEEAEKQLEAVFRRGRGAGLWWEHAILGMIRANVELRRYERADELFAEFRKQSPDSGLGPAAIRWQTKSLLARRRFSDAEALIRWLAEQTSAPAEDRYLYAASLDGLGRREEALRWIEPLTAESVESRLRTDAQLLKGTILVALGRFAEAIEPLESFLKTEPKGEAALKACGALAVASARSGRIDRAKALFERMAGEFGEHPLFPALVEQLAEAAYSARDTEFAARLFARLREAGHRISQSEISVPPPIARDEAEIKGMSGLGWSQYKAGRYAEAERTFEQLLRREPPPPPEVAAEAALVRGYALQELGRFEAALAMFDLVAEKYEASPHHADALLAAARLRDRLEQDAQAVALYEKMVTRYPQHPQVDRALYHWAWALRDLNRSDDADQLFERILRDHPKSPLVNDVRYRLAQRAAASGDSTRAKKLLDELSADNPEESLRRAADLLRAQVAVAERDWPTVEALCSRWAPRAEGPDRLWLEFWWAESHYRRDQLDQAERLFEGLAQRTAGEKQSWLGMVPLRRAQILAQRGRWSEARALAESIEKSYPNFELQYEADFLLGRCLHALAELEQAREAFGRVIRSPQGAKTETAAKAQWWIAETFFHQKNYEAALREYLRLEILYDFPQWRAAALLQAGKCQTLLGSPQEARRLFERLLKNYPDSEFASEARAALEKLPPSPSNG